MDKTLFPQKLDNYKEVIRIIKTRKLGYFGHMSGEKYQILQLILKGKIQGRRSKQRPRINWLQNLGKWLIATTNYS